MLKQRIWINSDKNYFRDLLETIKKNKGCCDEVWLSVQEFWESAEKVEKYLTFLVPVAEEFRKAGVEVSVEMSAIGHGTRPNAYYDWSGIENMSEDYFAVDGNGNRKFGQFCWNNPQLREHRRQIIDSVCRILHPHALYFDDDLRIRDFNSPLRCFCDGCVAKFNKENRSDYTREQLIAAVNSDVAVREKFIEFSYRGIADYCYDMGKVIACYPEVHAGVQHGAYSGDAFVHCLQALHRATGRTVMSRSGGGGYNDSNPNELIVKNFENICQLARLPDCVEDKCNEVENYPRSFYSKTVYGTVLETTLNLASGFNGTSYMMTGKSMDRELQKDFFAACSLRRKYWDKLVSANSTGKKGGLTIYVPCNFWSGKGRDWAIDISAYGRELNYLGIPLTFSEGKDPVYLLPDAYADLLTEEEITKLLSSPVVTNGRAMEILAAKGDFFGAKAVPVENSYPFNEVFTDHAINAQSAGEGWGQALWPTNDHYFLDLDGSTEALSVYRLRNRAEAGKGAVDGQIAAAIVRTREGGRWFVQGYRENDNIVTFAKKRQIDRAIRFIGKTPPCCEILSRNRAMLIPVEDASGRLLTLTVLNTTIQQQGNIKLFVRSAQRAVCSDEFGNETMLCAEKTDGGTILSVDSLNGWTAKTIFFENSR